MTPLEVQVATVLTANLVRVSLADQGVTTAVQTFNRMLEGSDPNYSVGVYFTSWAPVDRPEIGGWNEPTIGRYVYGIQTFAKSSTRADGEKTSAVFVKRVRQMLYRDAVLRSQLSILSETDDTSIERFLRHGVVATDYSDASIAGGFAFLSQTEFFIESEVA